MKISKRGNDLAVRLPARLVRELGIEAGDEVDIDFVRNADGKIVATVRKPEATAAAGA